ncbi:DNA replication and repair protein RecF [Thiohalocapsa marina]|uniref:DNA replication and repair protein RecF n=1 Tax=Thiohalocapsa marina TaxID=424902 RepID=A0A5M8FTW7_9GAMM|nr:DNA replication and repair protein RecF [Thiohalocapsa marina]KAA6187252.1 DNA replication and repair protein RecF [Thiohalocapsa marina]
MAWIEHLRIRGLRNLAAVELSLSEGHVCLVGGNGAGKTSLLEAVYLVNRGGSFRGRRHGPVVMHGAAGASIDLAGYQGGHAVRRQWRSELGVVTRETGLPVRLVGSAMHALVEGDPELRRRFIDWNVFHVEHGLAELRSRLRRSAAQRNAWLRAGGQGAAIWDAEYAAALSILAKVRADLLDRLRQAFHTLALELGVLDGLELVWRSDIPTDPDQTLAVLQRQLPGDVGRGYTYLSASRGDFCLQRDGTTWVGSRGQNKTAGVLLQLAADRVVREQYPEPSIWLVDDLPAELDRERQALLYGAIRAASTQVLSTALESPGSAVRQAGMQVFHVEHGTVRSMPSLRAVV